MPLPTTPNLFYVIGQVINLNSQAGTLGTGSGPGGGFGGTLGAGLVNHVLLGLVPLPNVFGDLGIPLNIGSPGTYSSSAVISANAVTISVIATGWSTGVVQFDDRAEGTLSTGGLPFANPVITSGTVTGSNLLGPNGGSISLVTPFVLRVGNFVAPELRAGYGVLSITFIPEPAILVLLGAGVAGLVAKGRRNT